MPNCSFCGRPDNEVQKLVGKEGGPLICNRCVGSAAEALGQQVREDKDEDKPVPNPREIMAHLDQYVIGQESARKDVSVAIYKHFRRREAAAQNILLGTDLEDVEIEKSNILMLGPSGTGKTHIARAVARFLGLPFYVADATKLTQAGYVGEDVETMLQGLVADAGGDIERAEWGVIVVDEFDKLCRKSGRGATGYRDVSGEGVQQALLRLVEGGVVMVPRKFSKVVASMGDSDPVDTTNILFICMGSFASGAKEVVTKRVNKDTSIGFGAKRRTKKDLDMAEIYSQVIEEDLLELGIIHELAGRLPVLTSTLPLTEGEMFRILTEPKNAIAKQFQAQFAMDRMKLTFDDAAYRAIANEAIDGETGARALRRILERVLKPFVFQYAGKDSPIEALHITEDVVAGDQDKAILTPVQKAATG